METFGRNNIEDIAKMLPGKTVEEVTKYHKVFWSRGKTELLRYDSIVKQIQRKEAKREMALMAIMAEKMSGTALKWKIESKRYHELDFTIKNRHSIRGKENYTIEQDNFLLVTLYKHGLNDPDVYARIREDIL